VVDPCTVAVGGDRVAPRVTVVFVLAFVENSLCI
jgi:hypothetical protein